MTDVKWEQDFSLNGLTGKWSIVYLIKIENWKNILHEIIGVQVPSK